jgi:hypothetical protein
MAFGGFLAIMDKRYRVKNSIKSRAENVANNKNLSNKPVSELS